MKRIPSHFLRSLTILLAVSGALALQLNAQSDHSITASIPFPFAVGTHTMEAGTYQFGQPAPYQVSILNLKTRVMQIFPVHPGGQGTLQEHERVRFHVVARRSFLSEVDFQGDAMLVNVSRNSLREETRVMQQFPKNAVSVAQR